MGSTHPFYVGFNDVLVDPAEPTQEFAGCHDTVAKHRSFGEIVELVKFALIVLVTVMHFYEHALQRIF